MSRAGATGPDTLTVEGRADLFGYPSEHVRVTVRPRSPAWRMGGAARTMAIALLIAPAAAVVPPHAPWVIGALAGGAILARRRWAEHFTVEAVDGVCPKCRAAIRVKPGRLRTPHPLPCETCHHDSTLSLPPEKLEARDGAGA